jgi:hypothetical protein
MARFLGTPTKRPSTKRPRLQNVLPTRHPSTKRPFHKMSCLQNIHGYKTSMDTKCPPLQNVLPSKYHRLQNVLAYKTFFHKMSFHHTWSIYNSTFIDSHPCLQLLEFFFPNIHLCKREQCTQN